MRLGALALAVPVGNEEENAPTRGVLVAAHEIVFRSENIQGIQIEEHTFARLPLAHRAREAVEALPDRYRLTRRAEVQHQQRADQERERQPKPHRLLHGITFSLRAWTRRIALWTPRRHRNAKTKTSQLENR